jgi:hypothetical protein
MAIIATVFAYACYLRIFGGFTLQRIASPDGGVIAEVNTSGLTARTLRSDGRIRRNLSITCENCAKLNGGNVKLDRWREVAIHYEIW